MGFILAAVGSAVGLGNMWRFSYVAAEGGGAAFVVLYVALIFIVGVPILLAEMALGRSTRLSPMGALRAAGGKAWVPMGALFVLTGLLILSYYSVIAGWTVRYAIEALAGGFPGNPGEHFGEIASGRDALAYHLGFMAVTIAVVTVGIRGGIEKAALVLMPVLFLILAGLAVWAYTLDGAAAGYSFYLRPSIEELLNPAILSDAAGQAFFSLSLGMGAMLTFASYLSRDENLNREATVISISDFMVAFIAGLVVFPVIFHLGLQDQVSESTVGALFISLPGAFTAMGPAGRVVGTLFFVALAVGALTSAISLLEVVVSSVMDELRVARRTAAIAVGTIIAGIGVFPALSLDLLGILDQLAGTLFLVVGALGISIFVGWRMKGAEDELRQGASGLFLKVVPAVMFMLRWVVPPIIALVLVTTVQDTIQVLAG